MTSSLGWGMFFYGMGCVLIGAIIAYYIINKTNMSRKDLDEYHNIGRPIKWNTKFTYPKSSRSLVMGQRHYDVNNNKLPSVTTILSQTQSIEKQESIARWKAKVGENEATRVKDQAAIEAQTCTCILKGIYLVPVTRI